MLLFIFLDFSGCFCVSVPTTSKVSRSEHRQKMMGASCQDILQLHEILSCQEENMTLTRPEQKNKVKVLISCLQNCYYRTAWHQNRLYIFCSLYKWHSWWPGEQKVHNTEQPLASAAIQSLTNSKLFVFYTYNCLDSQESTYRASRLRVFQVVWRFIAQRQTQKSATARSVITHLHIFIWVG